MGEVTMVVVVGPNGKEEEGGGRWGTWEELVLGGAVLRHGTKDWNVVALELRARSLSPYCFTPEACKAKYEDLRKRYSGCTAWFEELRKKRVAELKRELEKSEDVIGSLESKIKRLKAERGHSNQDDLGPFRADSPAPVGILEAVEFVGKEASKDGLSAGSFTQDTRKNRSSQCQNPEAALVAQIDTKLETSSSSEQEKQPSVDKPIGDRNRPGVTVRKGRGKRKRKDSDRDAKEGSIGESDNLGSASALSASRSKETSTSECNQTLLSYGTDNRDRGTCGLRCCDFIRIFNSIAQNEFASVFRHRLDGQKRARYKKIIRQHLDFGIIRSRIIDGSIKSARQLFRDLLLLANNALIFYSRRTREYKSAFSLRDVVTKAYRQYCKGLYNKASFEFLPLSPLCNPPGKPRSARRRPCKDKLLARLPSASNVVVETRPGNEKSIDVDSNVPLQLLLMAKKRIKRPGNAICGSADNPRPKTPRKERKQIKGTKDMTSL